MTTPVATRQLTTAKAIAEAIAQEMERDERVFALGEDIGTYGGIFGVTEGLLDRFGPERVMETPISETGFIGAAGGAAISGLRPIAELMFADFFGVCMDQIYNHMAKIHYGVRRRDPCPDGADDRDRRRLQRWRAALADALRHIRAPARNMKVVVPSTPYDAKGLMIAAIRDDDPVVYLFHKGVLGLGWMTINPRATGPVPEEAYTVPIGTADVKRAGTDVTIATVAMMVHRALDAAERLAEEGIEAEVLDLRSLVPLDREAIAESVRKTRRLLVVDEDYRSYGMSGEVITTAVEQAFDYLDAPPARLAVPDVPIPYSRPLEQFALPQIDGIVDAARALVRG